MKISALSTLFVAAFLTGCISEATLLPVGSADARYDITSYREATSLSSDLTGLWMAIHRGTLTETKDGVDYTVTGNIREIVEVTKSGEVYYLRTCLKPEIKNVMTVSGNTVVFAVNDEQAQLTKTGNTAMSGNASHSVSASSYTGTLKMKKVAALNETFGLFNYLNASLGKDVATASCFQEASLRIVGSKFSFSKWADVELANITDWSSATFQQTGYLFSRDGTADPVKQVRFSSGTVASSAVVREYPVGNEAVALSTSASTHKEYAASFSVAGVITGTVDLDFTPLAASGVVTSSTATGESAATGTPAPTTPGSFDFLSMLSWMAGLFKLQLPW